MKMLIPILVSAFCISASAADPTPADYSSVAKLLRDLPKEILDATGVQADTLAAPFLGKRLIAEGKLVFADPAGDGVRLHIRCRAMKKYSSSGHVSISANIAGPAEAIAKITALKVGDKVTISGTIARLTRPAMSPFASLRDTELLRPQ